MTNGEKKAAAQALSAGTLLQVLMVLVGHGAPAVRAAFAALGLGLALVTGLICGGRARWRAVGAAALWGAITGAVAGDIGVLMSYALGDVPASLLLLAGGTSAVAGALGAAVAAAVRRRGARAASVATTTLGLGSLGLLSLGLVAGAAAARATEAPAVQAATTPASATTAASAPTATPPAAAGASTASVAGELPIIDTSFTLPSGERVLQLEAIVAAPRHAVWQAFTTSEGLRSFVAPVAAIDLRVGGDWEATYDPARHLGQPGNIHNEVLSWFPDAMLSVRVREAPPGFPWPEVIRHVFTVIRFDDADGGRTRVVCSMLPWKSGPGWDELYAAFARDNATVFRHLQRRFATGRPIDWAAERTPPPHR